MDLALRSRHLVGDADALLGCHRDEFQAEESSDHHKSCKSWCRRSTHPATTVEAKEEVTMLTTKVALITGGARGIGAGIARAMARQGGRVALLDLDGAEAEKTAAGLPTPGMAFVCDVRSRPTWRQWCGRWSSGLAAWTSSGTNRGVEGPGRRRDCEHILDHRPLRGGR